MILCSTCEIPCCDFCIHCIHSTGEINGKMVKLAPIGCSLHEDKEHQDYAKGCYYCDDFYCFNVK